MTDEEVIQVVGLVADDLTGAADAAVQFAEAGWQAVLVRHPGRPLPVDLDRPTVLAMATGVRAAADREAAERTTQVVRELVRAGAQRLYVKIDSTARGSVAAQISGALTAWREDHEQALAVICPAFPELGRTVEHGVVLVHGLPLAQTAAAADPVTPVTVSRLDELIPGAIPADLAGRPTLRSQSWFDASTRADLDRIAATTHQLGPLAVAVGSAGLAAAVAREWIDHQTSGGRTEARELASGRILVAVSSLHPTALAQTTVLRASGCPGVELLTAPAVRGDTPAAIASAFADRVVRAVRQEPPSALVLVGGDGAAAVLDRLGAELVTIDSNVLAGTPHGQVVGGLAHGLRLVTRSGGFGGPDHLVTLVRRLLAATPDPPGTEAVPASPSPKDVS